MRPDPPNSPAASSDGPRAGEIRALKHPREAAILRRRRGQAAVEVFLIFCLFFVYAGWPAPDVNESHYLCKVKQAWDPDWLPGDFFLNTADAHPVFTWTLGWMTLFLPLPAVAWTGRVLTWLALAWAWRRLSYALVSRGWYALLSAGLLVAFGEIAAPAGEWMIGGFEAKGPAFALVLLAIERVVRNRWGWAFVLLGAASAFHVLVGGWAAVAVGIAWLLEGRRRPPLKRIGGGLFAGFGLALLGLLPAIALSEDATGDVLYEANRTYVFWRLRHHLDPASFRLIPLVVQGFWAAACVGALFTFRRFQWHRRLGKIVLGAVAIALVGYAARFALAWHPDALAAVLRLYWFRLADVMVPAGIALAFMTTLSSRRPHTRGTLWLAFLLLFPALVLGKTMYDRRGKPPRADGADLAAHRDWLGVCEFAGRTTPADARFLTPLHARTFHWHAHRAEVANWKDIPQDAVSIFEWSQRIGHIYYPDGGPMSLSLAEQPTDEVRELADYYQAGYVITLANPLLDLPRVYGNRTYALYRMPLPSHESADTAAR